MERADDLWNTGSSVLCDIVIHGGNIVPPPSCLLSSLSTMSHKSQLHFESGFYLDSRWYSDAQAVPRNSFYCTCGIHSSQIRPESNFSLDALITQTSGMRSLWHFRFVVVLFDAEVLFSFLSSCINTQICHRQVRPDFKEH